MRAINCEHPVDWIKHIVVNDLVFREGQSIVRKGDALLCVGCGLSMEASEETRPLS